MGTLSGFAIKLAINNGFRIAKPIINGILAKKPIEFPHEVLGLFKLEAITLAYYDNYLYAGITPVFIGPNISHSVWEPTNYDDNGVYFVECVTLETYDVLEDGTEYLNVKTYESVYEVPFEEEV